MKMARAAELQLRGLLAAGGPTEEQVLDILMGWDRYFARLRILGDDQLTEINGIMRARVRSGSISLVAPNLDRGLQ